MMVVRCIVKRLVSFLRSGKLSIYGTAVVWECFVIIAVAVESVKSEKLTGRARSIAFF